jgi:hypothetical protein
MQNNSSSIIITIQWALLDGIMVNDFIIWFNQIYQSQNSQLHLMYVSSSFAYWYHLGNGITLGLAQSDLIKRLPLS